MRKFIIIFTLLLSFIFNTGVEAADINPGQDSTINNTIILSGDTLIIDDTGIVLNNCIVYAITITANVTANNTIFPGTVSLANGITLTANNCIFNESEETIETSSGIVTGGDYSLFETDPLFVGAGGTDAGDYYVSAGSPCIDAGDNSVATATDFNSNPRVIDFDEDGTATIDIGPFEMFIGKRILSKNLDVSINFAL